MSDNKYIKSLDGVRAVAILLVMTYHAEINHYGWAGVQLFFVMSGFLITGILWNERKKKEPISAKFKSFWIRRSLRIFPLYFGYLFVITIAYLLFKFPSYFETYFPYLITYTTNFTRLLPDWQGNPLFTHLWSLAIEEQFYLIFPFFILLGSPKFIRVFLILVLIFSPIFRYFLGNHYLNMGLETEVAADAVNFHTLSHMDSFCFGGLIPVFALNKKIKKPLRLFFIIFLIAIAVGVINFLHSPDGFNYWEDLGFNRFLMNNYQPVWMFSIVNLTAAALILLLVNIFSTTAFASNVKKFFEQDFLVQIGKVSYGMYVFHWVVLVYIFNNIYKPESIGGKLLMFIPYTITVFLVAKISYNLFEKHFIKLKDRFTPEKKKT